VEQLTRRTSTLFPVAVLLLAIASTQAGASIAKTMFPVTGTLGTAAIRIGVGTIILVLALRPWRARITAGTWQPLAVYGISLGLMNSLYYKALSIVPLGIAVALEFAGPLAVVVWFSHRPLDLCWLALAAGGMALLLPIAHVSAGVDPVGALYALAAGACWALYIVFGQKAGANHGAQTAALGSVISAILIVPIGVVSAGSALLSRSIIVPGLAIAFLSTALPYTLEMLVLTRLPAQTFGILMSLEPAFAALFGFAYLGERLKALQWVAIAMVILASIGSTATAKRQVPAPLDG
jgi:inner membrane transporter RhtA